MTAVTFGRVRGRVEILVRGDLSVADVCAIARAAMGGAPTLIDLTHANKTGSLALLDSMFAGCAPRVTTVGQPLAGAVIFKDLTAARRWLG